METIQLNCHKKSIMPENPNIDNRSDENPRYHYTFIPKEKLLLPPGTLSLRCLCTMYIHTSSVLLSKVDERVISFI